MIKHCPTCNDHGEIADPKADCKCGIERISCPTCNGYSNTAYSLRRIENKIDKLLKRN